MTFRIGNSSGNGGIDGVSANVLPVLQPLANSSTKTFSRQDSKFPVPTAVEVDVFTKDKPSDIEYRALYKAARQAGLPHEVAQDFARRQADGKWSFVGTDPSPDDNRQAKKSDSPLVKEVSYELNKYQRAELETLQHSHKLAGGELGKALPSRAEMAAQKRGMTGIEAHTRRQVEAKLPPSNSATGVSNANGTSATKTLADYRTQAVKLIEQTESDGGGQADVRERNRRITGAYADLYMKNPEAFVWLGAAAYASGQVGFALDEATDYKGKAEVINNVIDMEVLIGSRGSTRLNMAEGSGVIAEVGAEMEKNIREMLGKGNIAIFESIYPASLAYQQGGMAELKRVHSQLPLGEEKDKFGALVSAYELIDKGVQMNKQQPNSGDQLIKDGTNAIIRFEQEKIAQPIFDEYAKTVRLISPFSFGDLDADDTKIDAQTLSTFYKMETVRDEQDKEIGVVPKNVGKSIGDVKARIEWITNDIFPKWDEQRKQRFEETKANMQRMIEAGRKAGGQY